MVHCHSISSKHRATAQPGMESDMTNFSKFIAAAVALGAVGFASQASAASLAVQYACMSDYFRYCSAHNPDSNATRQCMNRNGNNLSKRCVNALVAAGEVSRSEVNRRAARAVQASRR